MTLLWQQLLAVDGMLIFCKCACTKPASSCCRAVWFHLHSPPGLATSVEPAAAACSRPAAEDDRRASLARDRWRVLEHEQQAQQAQQQAANGAAEEGTGESSGGGLASAASASQQELAAQEAAAESSAAALAALLHVPPQLFPEAELVVEPEAADSDDDGAGRDEHVRQLVQQYKQQAAEVCGLWGFAHLGGLRPVVINVRPATARCSARTYWQLLCGVRKVAPMLGLSWPMPCSDAQGEGYSEEELPNSLVDELEERVSPEQRHFAAFQARVSLFFGTSPTLAGRTVG